MDPHSCHRSLPPRVNEVARAERSPGFGPSLAFPVSQWRVERGGWLPVTVAGPRRICTGFRNLRNRVNQLDNAISSSPQLRLVGTPRLSMLDFPAADRDYVASTSSHEFGSVSPTAQRRWRESNPRLRRFPTTLEEASCIDPGRTIGLPWAY
jgi:hypothetical protein